MEVSSICFMGSAGRYFPHVASLPRRNTSVPVGVCSWWYFDYSWQKPLSWLCVYFWLTDITLAILNSICKYRVKSMTVLDYFQILPSTYNPYRLSTYVYNAANYISPHWTMMHELLVISCSVPKMCQEHEMLPENSLYTTWEMIRSKDCLTCVVFLHACVLLRTADLPWQHHPCVQRAYDTMATPKCTSENHKLCVLCAVGNLMKQWTVGMQTNYHWQLSLHCLIIYEILAKYFSCWLNRVLPVKEHRM